ncbi:MAG: hypothetical protein IPL79_17560 [Myxococcales bacterium]|nr:hypothetical protein [Myxococcales bacterium]
MNIDDVLQRALATRLNLQIALSSLAVIEEWMDLHIDRWLDNVPAPPEMPMGCEAQFEVVLGSDLRQVTWSAWGDPRGFVPKLANYFQLCVMGKQDSEVLDQLGNELQPEQVGSWLTVTPGKVLTGWQFCEPIAWARLQESFAPHAAKLAVHAWLERNDTEQIERFAQAIGDGAYSELEIAMPGDDAAAQLAALARAVPHFGGEPLPAALIAWWAQRAAQLPAAASDETGASNAFAVVVRIAQGAVTHVGALGPGIGSDGLGDLAALATACSISWDSSLARVVPSLSAQGVRRLAYVQASGRASLQLYVEPGDPAVNPNRSGKVVVKPPASSAN